MSRYGTYFLKEKSNSVKISNLHVSNWPIKKIIYCETYLFTISLFKLYKISTCTKNNGWLLEVLHTEKKTRNQHMNIQYYLLLALVWAPILGKKCILNSEFFENVWFKSEKNVFNNDLSSRVSRERHEIRFTCKIILL